MRNVTSKYYLYFVEQCDSRPFNRGALKNIGFIAMRQLHPNDYSKFIFVFNDIDTIPYDENILKYNARKGIISHHYGFDFALGGIVSVVGSDFELLNGYPNYWTWGFEDNILQTRAVRNKLLIDRSNFFELGDLHILHINDGNKRSLNRSYGYEVLQDSGYNGISTIRCLEYEIHDDIISVKHFETEYPIDYGNQEVYDIRNGRTLHYPLPPSSNLHTVLANNDQPSVSYASPTQPKLSKPHGSFIHRITNYHQTNAKESPVRPKAPVWWKHTRR